MSKEKTHNDHIADRSHVSMTHYNMVHRPTSIFKAGNFPARVAMDRDWGKWKQLSVCGMLIYATIPLDGRTQLKTPLVMQDSRAIVTSNILHPPHNSASIFSSSKHWASKNGEILFSSSKSGMKLWTSPESWPPRDTLRDMERDRRLNHTFTSSASQGKSSSTRAKHIEDCKVSTEDWLAPNFELSRDSSCVN